MAGNSSRPGARRAANSRHGVAFLNALIALCVALVLSFFLGFFVFARMIAHDSKKPPKEAPNPAVADEEAEKAARAKRLEKAKAEKAEKAEASHASTEETPESGSAKKGNHRQIQASNGPTLSPEEDGQKPDPVDSGPGTGTRAQQPRTQGAGDGIQTPGTPDTAATPGESAAQTPKVGLYKVQLGVFSTRAKAEEAAEAASDKGVKTSIRVITRGERTLYRVQHSSHKERKNAEAEVQKLNDLGLEASLVEPN
jgi:cytoskeletal protein RodZ